MISIENVSCFFCEDISDNKLYLSPEESNHCANSLRHKLNDIVLITNGRGTIAQCKIIEITHDRVQLKILKKEFFDKSKNKINIFVGIPQSNNVISLIVEKLTELQANEINFIITKNSERNKVNLSKLRRVSISALKQSKNPYLPDIKGPFKFKEVIKILSKQKDCENNIVCAYSGYNFSVLKEKLMHNCFNVFIGPEGGFSNDEIKLMEETNFFKLKLSDTILRTETACITAMILLKNC